MLLVAPFLLAGCVGLRTVDQSIGHVIDDEPAPPQARPLLVPPPEVQKPAPLPPAPTYSVVVKDVPAADILFSLAREAGLELDLQAGV